MTIRWLDGLASDARMRTAANGAAKLLREPSTSTAGDEVTLTLDAPYGDVESSTSTGFTAQAKNTILVEAQDFTNLQQEYNKLMFKKHEV